MPKQRLEVFVVGKEIRSAKTAMLMSSAGIPGDAPAMLMTKERAVRLFKDLSEAIDEAMGDDMIALVHWEDNSDQN